MISSPCRMHYTPRATTGTLWRHGCRILCSLAKGLFGARIALQRVVRRKQISRTQRLCDNWPVLNLLSSCNFLVFPTLSGICTVLAVGFSIPQTRGLMDMLQTVASPKEPAKSDPRGPQIVPRAVRDVSRPHPGSPRPPKTHPTGSKSTPGPLKRFPRAAQDSPRLLKSTSRRPQAHPKTSKIT